MTCGWTGVWRPVFRKVPLLITDSCRHTHFWDEIWWKATHFLRVFAKVLKTHPCLKKICRKRIPCLENFGPKNPPIWAAYTLTFNMLCYPPGGCHAIFAPRNIIFSVLYSCIHVFYKKLVYKKLVIRWPKF